MKARIEDARRRAVVHLGLCPDPAAVLLDNALVNGQSDTRSFKVRRRVQSLEGPKQALPRPLDPPVAGQRRLVCQQRQILRRTPQTTGFVPERRIDRKTKDRQQ